MKAILILGAVLLALGALLRLVRLGALAEYSAAGLRGDLFLPRGTLTRGEANRCLAAFADYIVCKAHGASGTAHGHHHHHE